MSTYICSFHVHVMQTYSVAGRESSGAAESFWDLWVGLPSKEAAKLRYTLMGRLLHCMLSNYTCTMASLHFI